MTTDDLVALMHEADPEGATLLAEDADALAIVTGLADARPTVTTRNFAEITTRLLFALGWGCAWGPKTAAGLTRVLLEWGAITGLEVRTDRLGQGNPIETTRYALSGQPPQVASWLHRWFPDIPRIDREEFEVVLSDVTPTSYIGLNRATKISDAHWQLRLKGVGGAPTGVVMELTGASDDEAKQWVEQRLSFPNARSGEVRKWWKRSYEWEAAARPVASTAAR